VAIATKHVAWVTGGASGIGAAVVSQLAEEGSTVGVLDLQSPEPGVVWQAVDVGDPDSVDAAVEDLRRHIGWPDQLVLCAGIAGEGHSVSDYPLEVWSRVLAVNLTGALVILRRTFPEMCQRGFGRIVTVSSGTAVRPGAGTAGYAASKAGLIALTKVVALEGAPHGVTANVVAPGITDTPMTRLSFGDRDALRRAASHSPIANPQGEVLEPGDVAAAIVFLCREQSSRITGQVLHVNGGSIMP
jgi:NAD(P)-dependent dehydrogenase (short-subunit alcohol dehydrogenase family)